ncbi:MAG: methyltransferase domain-containing protein [Pseudomonadota bacterium]
MTDTAAFEKMEKDGWGDPSVARSYASDFSLATSAVAQSLADKVMASAGLKVLDLCCGHGVVAAELYSRGAAVTGLDFSAAMIALAKDNVPNVKFVQGDALDMDFPDQYFNAITIGFGVPHFPDHLRGLTEAFRVLKPSGRIAFSIWRGKGSRGAFGWLFDAVGRLGNSAVTLPPGPDAHILAERAEAEAMMRKAGFVQTELIDLATRVQISEPEALFDLFDRGAVRAASLLAGQSTECRDAIRQDLAARVRAEGVKNEAGYLVETPSVVVSASRS